MMPWPALERFAPETDSPETGATLFFYDSESEAEHATEKDGPLPVILIHGLGDEADSWRHLFPLLARTRRVIAPDLPGFGRSSSRKHISLDMHAKAVCALLKETGPAILVGNSLGAAVVELAAFRSPGLVRAIAFIDGGLPSAAGGSSGILLNILPFIAERKYRAYRKNTDAAFRSLAPYYADLTALGSTDLDFLKNRVTARVMSETQLRAYFSSLRSYVLAAVFRSGFFRRNLKKIKIPLLVIWGEKDRILPPESMSPLCAIRLDATVISVPDAGHLPHQEKSEETAAILDRFFSTYAL